ncbi:unnamed protein product, partial [Ixodes hexagonus]
MPRTKQAVRRKSRSSVVAEQAAHRSMLEYFETVKSDVDTDMSRYLEQIRTGAEALCLKSDVYFDRVVKKFKDTGLLEMNFLELMGEKEPDPFAYTDSDSASCSTAPPSTGGFSSGATRSTVRKQTKGRVRVAKNMSGGRSKRRTKGAVKKSLSEDRQPRERKKSRSGSHLARTPSVKSRSALRPVITPKFDVRRGRTPSVTRKARKGEVLVSLSGSPVQNENPAPLKPTILLPLANGKV